MRRLRTFIALDPGKAARERLAALQKQLQRVGAHAKWVERDNHHLTLLFLGEVEMTQIPKLCATVAAGAAQHAAFTLSLEKVGCFPNARRPRVLWVGVGQGAQEVVALHDDLEERLLELGCYRREDRQYTPHLTLGRVEGDRHNEEIAKALEEYIDWQGGELTVKQVRVMSSELLPTGPIYTVLSRANLA